MSGAAPTSLPPWPPAFADKDDEAYLVALARDWALSHSLVYRPVLSSSGLPHTSDVPFNTSVIHAPFALFPTPFPRALYELVRGIQKSYNALYCQIASDFAFLERVIGGNVAKVDEFQGGLWKIAQQVRNEGIVQRTHLGLFRSDYLLHQPTAVDPLEVKQVEFNTISSSFGALSSKVTQLHRFLAQINVLPSSLTGSIRISDLPQNRALVDLAGGIASAHKAYGAKDAKVLFVVQDPERNAFDQRPLEWELLERHGVEVLRLSFTQIHHFASLSADASRTLLVSHPHTAAGAPVEISTVYFRAGYAPTDYPSQTEWDTRLLLERSAAIKCPSVALQLAGAKKVQQVLAEPGVLESFAGDAPGLSQDDIEGLKATFTALYPMDDSELGAEAERLARTHPERFVLKPQREGGGNNVYRENIPGFLDDLEKHRRIGRFLP